MTHPIERASVEQLGEALYALSALLASSGFLSTSANQVAYEAVVAEFGALDAAIQQARDAGFAEGGAASIEAAIDRMGWPEIHAFQDEMRKGQDVREDAGGYMIRCIKALFGIKPRDEVLTYQDAARAMITEALSAEANVGRCDAEGGSR